MLSGESQFKLKIENPKLKMKDKNIKQRHSKSKGKKQIGKNYLSNTIFIRNLKFEKIDCRTSDA